VVRIAGQNHLGDGAGLVLAVLYFEHRLVLVWVERLAERRLDASDAVLLESVLQGSFAGGDPGQQVSKRLVFIWQTRWYALQRTRQIVGRLQEILYQLRSREPHCIVALALEAAPEVLLFGQYAQQLLLERCRILLGRAGRLLSRLFWRSAFASDGCR
jgi:hypothetical protein